MLANKYQTIISEGLKEYTYVKHYGSVSQVGINPASCLLQGENARNSSQIVY